MIPREWLWTVIVVLVFCMTAAGIIAHGQYLIVRELHAFRVQQAEMDRQNIEMNERNLCVLWLTGEQRADERGKAGTPIAPTWSMLCDWMRGIRP